MSERDSGLGLHNGPSSVAFFARLLVVGIVTRADYSYIDL